MTTFSYPLTIKTVNPPATGVGAATGKVPAYYIKKVSVGDTGTAVGSTTIPLFVLPAGSRVVESFIDVVTAYDPAASNTNLRVGTSTSTGIVFAATTVNTVGRRVATETGAQVSALGIVFSADTTIDALVSIDTSAVTAGEVIVYVVAV